MPPEIRADHGVVRVALRAVLDPHTLMPAFSYAGGIGNAPTLRVHPGDRIEIAYTNALPANAGMGNATNLHFHGLVTSPKAPGDETLHTMAMPGQTLHYVVHVARDQQPGLYWYHPHAHGNTFRQVGSGGMSGAIVVEGIERDVPALAHARERLIVVRDVADDLDHNSLIGHAELAPRENNGQANMPCLRTAGTHLTVNGAVDPQIAIAPSEVPFFRVLNATATRFLDLSIGRAKLALVALDGVPLRAYPGAHAPPPVSHLIVEPGARAEFTVTGAQPGDRLATACYDSGPDGDADPAGDLATIVAGAPLSVAAAPEVDATPRVNPLARAIPAPVRDRRVVFTETNRNGASTFLINGASYTANAPPLFTARSGTIERWTVINESREAHAFHIHQVHFATTEVDGKPVARYWRDTMLTPPATLRDDGTVVPSTTVMLVDFRDRVVRGTFVFHCHLLDHEDGGMMAKINVI